MRPMHDLAVCCCGACGVLAGVAAAQETTPISAPVHATRGLASSVTVSFPEPLRARRDQSPTSPVLVRVLGGDAPGEQRILFIGLTAGRYDLRDFVELVDGRAAEGLPPLAVEVAGIWPKGSASELTLADPPRATVRGWYTPLAVTAAGAWLAIPIVAGARRVLRRRRTTQAPAAAPARSAMDELRGLMGAGDPGSLSLDDRARLELLALSVLAGEGSGGEPEDGGARTRRLAALRQQPSTGPVILAMEHWLHAPAAGPESAAAGRRLLDLLERHLAAAPPAPGTEVGP